MKKNLVPLICAALCLVIFWSGCDAASWRLAKEPDPAPVTVTTATRTTHVTLTVYVMAGRDVGATTVAQEAAKEPDPAHPFTDEEVVMLAKTMGAEALVVPSKARQAAVAWCALNRLDDGRFGDTLADVLSAPRQFAYRENAEVYPEMLELAESVLSSWASEKQGDLQAGRTLPSDYLYFDGDGRENHFRKAEGSPYEWDWSLPDPYRAG